MNVNEGEVLAGKFRIERVLGRGGMGVVVAATHVHLGERVALKFLLPEALHNPEAVQRFAREARAAVRIKSEHVARVSDVGTLENGAPYVVMEYLHGTDLAQWLLQRGPLPIEQAVAFVLQACEALAEAHTLGIVHRDLKPANLFVIERPDGELAVKVLDFGISKTGGLGISSDGVTKTSTAMGSPLYMSPEQMQSAKDVDLRGDIWSLGVVLYELVSGRAPFPGETMAELVLKVVMAQPNPLRAACPSAPPGLEAVVLKCLEKDREQRYQHIGELAAALIEFAPRTSKISLQRVSSIMQRAGMAPSATLLPASSDHVGVTVVSASSVNPAPETLASWGQTTPPGRSRQRIALIAAALMAIPVLAIGAIAVHHARLQSVVTGQAAGSPLSTAVIEKPPARELGVVVAPGTASTPTAAANSALAPAISAPTAEAAPPSRQSKPPASVRALAKAPAAVATAAKPLSTAANVAPPPAASSTAPHAKNPLKMVIE